MFTRITARAFAHVLLAFCSMAAIGQQAQGKYKVRADQPQQKILGLGFEIQSDSIGTGNHGMPNDVIAIPHDLTPSERQRFYHDMLHGFRYSRLALGLYLRGLDADKKHIVERYPGQMKDLREMMQESGIEGFDVEYWSPAPYWKSTQRYEGGTIRADDPQFVDAFTDNVIEDLKYLQSNGLHIAMWALQNEPAIGHLDHPDQINYASCFYGADDYFNVMKVAVPKVRALLPNVHIHSNSWKGQADPSADLIRKDPALLQQIDAWTWHQIGHDSNDEITRQAEYTANAVGKPVYQNEFEYDFYPSRPIKPKDAFINTAQSIMNWMVFENSPTWFWLHALKPVSNFEAQGYALGFWRPAGDTNFTKEPNLQPGHWEYNAKNWNAIAGFLRYMPWDSIRLAVDEDTVRKDSRIMVWKSPAGKLGLVVTNRSGAPFNFGIALPGKVKMTGHRYTVTRLDAPLSSQRADHLQVTVPDQAIEFWIEQ
jgi:O-glycosyl hydrolase